MQITDNKVVSFHYTLTNDAGEIVDTSAGGEPMPYLHGAANIVPGLELALEGKRVGDKLNVTLEAADAYGEFDPALVEVVSAELFDGIDNIEADMEFETETESGDIEFVRVTNVDGDNITIDGNHPLAGQNLTFAVEITDIRDATAEELEHGHVHGDDDDDECCGEGCGCH
ncbi:FKBP-type peptidyl prolyl cis-trans isomerase [Mariprofundus ferrinatatus]|uniref:Peptidyl-prolyl cis-trans isomerase n=1 Tax=Mariprofundus ferrinatatus TaxID=1921087 RepID=A0A2K8L3K0_9PROT|nr:peptidylprolyl isomerase [Mariprofundus ferrinatatus]ATX81910.1 FKBP-type peptidyl prolyl cis-trans isomerase [Mariprofundus ferrinatatus]